MKKGGLKHYHLRSKELGFGSCTKLVLVLKTGTYGNTPCQGRKGTSLQAYFSGESEHGDVSAEPCNPVIVKDRNWMSRV